jgi:hypothetical protein
MNHEYYGPTINGAAEVNKLLQINATGREQDWEIEFSDASKIRKMLDIFENKDLSHEGKSALCLLILSSFESGLDVNEIDYELVHRAAKLIGQDIDVLARMRFYWIDLERASHKHVIRTLLGLSETCNP